MFFAHGSPDNSVPAHICQLHHTLWTLCSWPAASGSPGFRSSPSPIPGGAAAAPSWINFQTGSFVGQRFVEWVATQLTAMSEPSSTSQSALPSPLSVAQSFLDLRICRPDSQVGGSLTSNSPRRPFSTVPPPSPSSSSPSSSSSSASSSNQEELFSQDDELTPTVFDPSRRYVFEWLTQPMVVNAARQWKGLSHEAEVISERLQLLVQDFIDWDFQDSQTPGVFQLDRFLQSQLYSSHWAWQLCELQRADLSGLEPVSSLAILLNLYNILWLTSASVSRQAAVRRRATINVAGHHLSMEDLLVLIRSGSLSSSSSSSSSSASSSSSTSTYAIGQGMGMAPTPVQRRGLPAAVERDSRYHFALLRGKSGPWLQAWAPATLRMQLAEATASYLEANVAVMPDALTVVAPPLFEAHREDFTQHTGRAGDEGLAEWLAANATLRMREQLLRMMAAAGTAGRPVRFKFRERAPPLDRIVHAKGVISKNVRSLPGNVLALPTKFEKVVLDRRNKAAAAAAAAQSSAEVRRCRPHSGLHPEEIERERTNALLADLAADALQVPCMPCFQQRQPFSYVHQAIGDAMFRPAMSPTHARPLGES